MWKWFKTVAEELVLSESESISYLSHKLLLGLKLPYILLLAIRYLYCQMISLSMMDEVYHQPFLNKLSNKLKLFMKGFSQGEALQQE